MVLIKDTTGKYNHKNKWLLISKKKPSRVLRIFGDKKPKQSEVLKAEKSISMFKRMTKKPKYTIVKSHTRRCKK